MQLWPTVARNVRRVGPWTALVIGLRILWYWPWIGLRRWLARPAPRPDPRTIEERAPW